MNIPQEQAQIAMTRWIRKGMIRLPLNDWGCWEWVAGLDRDGYGKVNVTTATNKGASTTAHRVAFLAHTGSLTSGLVVDHMCQNRRCCNPEHLQEVTIMENLAASPRAKQFRNRKQEAIIESLIRYQRAFRRQRPRMLVDTPVDSPDLEGVTGGRLTTILASQPGAAG